MPATVVIRPYFILLVPSPGLEPGKVCSLSAVAVPICIYQLGNDGAAGGTRTLKGLGSRPSSCANLHYPQRHDGVASRSRTYTDLVLCGRFTVSGAHRCSVTTLFSASYPSFNEKAIYIKKFNFLANSIFIHPSSTKL